MSKMTNLEAKCEAIKCNIIEENKKFKNIVSYDGYEDIEVSPHVGWDEVRIQIQAAKNWTNFLDITIEKDKFDFSHGSGGWKDATVDEKLEATTKMFEVVRLLKDDIEKILAQRLIISRLQTDYSISRDILKQIKREEAKTLVIKELVKTHKKITVSEVLAKLETGGSIFIISIIVNHDLTTILQENEVENRNQTGRNNYYFQDYKYSKDNLISALETRDFYISL